MFSKACEYGIRAAIFLAAQNEPSQRVGIAEISESIGAPRHFTAKILQTLTRRKMVSSQKGVNGGFYIDDMQRNRTLLDFVSAIDGDNIFSGCGLGLRECSGDHPCPMHDQFMSVRNGLRTMLSGTTIGSLAHKLESGLTTLKNG